MIYHVEVCVTKHNGLHYNNVVIHRERRSEKDPNPCRYYSTRFDDPERAARRIMRGIRLLEALSKLEA